MVLLSSTKKMDLHPLELVIRRCPICLKDTEQDSFYVSDPDFSVEAMTPTTPQFKVTVVPKEEHKMNWYIVARCRSCGYLYKVTGIPQYKIKLLLPAEVKYVPVAIFCCDICYNERCRYETAEVFISLSEGKSVYLCEPHADEVERMREKDGSYADLINRFNVWKVNDAMPRAVRLDDGRVIVLNGDRGYMEQILRKLLEVKELEFHELIKRIMEDGLTHRTPKLIELQIEGLLLLELISDASKGGILKKRYLSLTGLGRAVAEKIGQ